MVFLSKSNTWKFSRIFSLIFVLFFIVLILLQYVKVPKEFKVNSKAKVKNSKPILFQSKLQESCLKKYMLDIQQVVENASQAFTFTSFHKVAEFLKVKPCIIEPSILNCMLTTKYRKLLTRRNFGISNFTGSQNIITFGILEEDVTIFQKAENVQVFRENGLQPYFVQDSLVPWMTEDSARFKNSKFMSHIFFMYYAWTLHVVVFYKRNNYLWHAALNEDENLKFLSGNKLLFANYDSAYENFTFDPILREGSSFPNIYVPSSPEYFLFQIPNSRFLECNLSRAIYIEKPTSAPNSTTTPSVSASSKFNKNMLNSLRELKTFFGSLLMNFWIHSGTLLGWYRQCDIIPYTSDVDFGAWASEIDDLDYIINYFRKNKKLYIVERMGLLEEALEFQLRYDNLRVDVFFMYKIDNGTWASGHRPSKGYYFRYHYPFFTLCSAELLQEKVQVPCEAEDVILIEYGDQWMHPVSSWYYESSIHNRGPNIYWDEKRRSKAFESY